MDIFFNKKKDITSNSIKKKIRELYKKDYELDTIHWIMKKSGLEPYERKMSNGRILDVYNKTDFEIAIRNNYIKNIITKIEVNKNQKLNNTFPKTDEESNIEIPKPNIPKKEYEEDYSTYKNDENDMEKYSDYLINNVYENKIHLTFNDLQEIVKKSVINILTENRGIKSKKLYDIIKTHGGIKSTRGIFDLHNMLDSDIIDVVDWSDVKNYKPSNLDIADEVDYIELKDGKYLLAKCRGAKFDRISKSYNDKREKLDGDFEFLNAKKDERYKNRYPRKEDYVWQNKDAEFIFNNPYFRQNDGNWTPERKKEVMNNIRNKREWWNNEKE